MLEKAEGVLPQSLLEDSQVLRSKAIHFPLCTALAVKYFFLNRSSSLMKLLPPWILRRTPLSRAP